METVIKRILASKVPVAIWVGPPGAQAASAGFYMLIAADVASMAPGTRTGAASAIDIGGEIKEDSVLFRKINEDMAALIRSIADRRGRNVEASEDAVFKARAYEETVALEKGLIDLIAETRDDLLAQLDGREVRRFDLSTVVLRTAEATFVETEFSFRHGFMEILALPWVSYMLFTLGLLGIYVEFQYPGTILPGVVGALCLLLFAISAQALPISSCASVIDILSGVCAILKAAKSNQWSGRVRRPSFLSRS